MASRGWTNDGPVSPYEGPGIHPYGGTPGPGPDPRPYTGPVTVAKSGNPWPIVYGTAPVNPVLLYAFHPEADYEDNPVWRPTGDPGRPWWQDQGPTSIAHLGICMASPLWPHSISRIKSEGTTWLTPDLFSRLVSRDTSIEWVTGMEAEPWSVTLPTIPIAYRGLVQMRCPRLTLRDGKIPGLQFEVKGRCAGADGKAHPADVAVDLLTASDIRAPRLSASQVVTDVGLDGAAASSWRTYCTARGFRVSRAITDLSEILGLVDELAGATNSTIVRSGNALKFVPLEGTPYTNPETGVTYLPAFWDAGQAKVQAVDLDEDEIIHAEGQDPIRVKTVPLSEVRNAVQITIRDEEAAWGEGTYQHKDAEHANRYGIRPADPISNGWITNRYHAVQIAGMLVQKSINVRSKFEFTLGPRWACLEPGDVCGISDGKFLIGRMVRVTAIEDQPDGSRSVFAEEWNGAAALTDLTPQGPDGYESPGGVPTIPNDPAPDFYADPGDAYAPAIVSLPYLYARDGVHIAIATAGGPQWGGCAVEAKWGDGPWTEVGTVSAPANYGVLSSDLAAGDPLDEAHSLALTMTAGSLPTLSAADRDDLTRPLIIAPQPEEMP